MALHRRLVDAVEVTENQIHVIRLKDIFDASTLDEFEKVMNYILARNYYQLVVDLSNVEFISSAGWGAFTAELRRVRHNNGDIKLAGMNHDVYDVFLLLELDSFIRAYETVNEAVAAFSSPALDDATSSSQFGEEPEDTAVENAGSESATNDFSLSSPIFENIPVDRGEPNPLPGEPKTSSPASESRVHHDDSLSSPTGEKILLPQAPPSAESFWGSTDDTQDADDEFGTHDIRDPWLFDDIDTLPEEGFINDQEFDDQSFSQPNNALTSSRPAFSAGVPIESSHASQPAEVDPSASATPVPMDILSPSARSAVDKTTPEPVATIGKPASFRGDELAEMNGPSNVRVVETVPSGEKPMRPRAFDPAAPERLQSPPVAFRKFHANGNLLELIRNIVFAHPHYGPTMIRRFLEARVEPPVQVSRSTVY
ncbi:MAG: STAS domain-containing protein, partial [candidate division KSB1 bacterium]|nr:STAS domain-containing protein [candidate division KSB1 bacterium]